MIRAYEPKMERIMLPENLVPLFIFLKSHGHLAKQGQINDLVWYANWRAAGGRGTYANMKAAGICSRHPVGASLIDFGLLARETLNDVDMLGHVRLITDIRSTECRRSRKLTQKRSSRLKRAAQERRDFINSL